MLIDVVGDLTLTFSVTALFLLVLGLPLVRGLNNRRNLKRHGILTVIALALQATLIFAVMVPSLINHISVATRLQVTYSFDTWFHVAAGSAAFASGFVYVAIWLAYYSSMRCIRARKYMTPTLIVWILAVFSGAVIYLFQMF